MKDYILVKLKDEFPFFTKKIMDKDGKTVVSENFHQASGVFSEYINLDIKEFPIAIEFQRGGLSFEMGNTDEYKVYLENTCENPLEIRLPEMDYCGYLETGEVVEVHNREARKKAQDLLKSKIPLYQKFITQAEINSLLSGKPL